MENTHNITLRSVEDIDTLAYFSELANKYENNLCKDEYEKAVAKQAYDIIPLVVDVKNGYVVLEDKTIRCSPSVSSFVAQFDGCTEAEMHAEYNAAIRGY